MTKPSAPADAQTTAKRPLPWTLEVVLAAVALGVSYAVASLAIDTGRLQYYALTLIFFGLGARHLLRTYRAWRRANG